MNEISTNWVKRTKDEEVLKAERVLEQVKERNKDK
jgi:hypothetical protein